MTDDDKPRYFSFEERQRQKARARQRDEERLERGEISELQRENMPFRKLRRDRVAIYRNKKTGEFVWMSFERKRGAEDGTED